MNSGVKFGSNPTTGKEFPHRPHNSARIKNGYIAVWYEGHVYVITFYYDILYVIYIHV